MTKAKLVTNPAEGHGLTDRITEPHFDALMKSQPIGLIPALVLLKPHGYGGNVTANGGHRYVTYEVARIEPITEPGDRDDALWKVQALYEQRTSTGSQRPLPLGLAGEERRVALMERLEEWADGAGVTGAELENQWRAHFGVNDPDGNLYGIPGDYRKASVQHLLQFAIEVGAEKQSDAAPTPPDDPDADGTED